MTDPRDTRIAELEAIIRDNNDMHDVERRSALNQIAVLEKRVDRLRHAVDGFGLGGVTRRQHADDALRADDELAQSPDPPAPVAQEKWCTGLDGECGQPLGHAGDCEPAPFDDEDAYLSGQPRKAPKPPDVDEPTIDLPRAVLDELFTHIGHPNHMIAALRLREDSTIIRPVLQAARAFIDSRKAAVSILDIEAERRSHDTTTRLLSDEQGERRKVEQERDRLREELAGAKAAAEQVGDQWREATAELSALKARPVVDVAKAVSDLKLGMAQSCDGQWGPESRLISARAALSNALESLQPASAKADSTKRYYCPMCGYETTEPGCVCPAPCPRVAKMLERPASAKADEKPTPMPSADPARVGEEEQENGDCGTSSGGRTRAVTRTCAQQ